MMTSFMDEIIANNEKKRPMYASKNWRMWSPKHTKVKVVDRHNGYFSLALRDDNPVIPRPHIDGDEVTDYDKQWYIEGPDGKPIDEQSVVAWRYKK